MIVRSNKGFTGVDVAISIIIMTMFIAVIGNIIIKLNINKQMLDKESTATSYAIQEIEKIKARGYIIGYDDKGITNEDLYEEQDILDSNGKNTGYHKKILIKDYVLIKNDNSKQENLVKQISVEISYKFANENKTVRISKYITKG